MTRKRSRTAPGIEKPSEIWDSLDWRTIPTDQENLGDFEDSVFLGLEELDGNAYVVSKNSSGYSVKPTSVRVSSKSKSDDVDNRSTPIDDEAGKSKKRKTIKQIREEKLASTAVTNVVMVESVPASVDESLNGNLVWGEVVLHSILQKSLIGLGFENPTPIQASAIPMIVKSNCDVVGAAETGSGKTLAFGKVVPV